jgi:hypothetical protein
LSKKCEKKNSIPLETEGRGCTGDMEGPENLSHLRKCSNKPKNLNHISTMYKTI